MKKVFLSLALFTTLSVCAQTQVSVTLHTEEATQKIKL